MSELVKTPMTDIPGTPSDHRGGEGVYNGEPNWPGRTSSPNALPEKTYDKCGEFGSAKTDKGSA